MWSLLLACGAQGEGVDPAPGTVPGAPCPDVAPSAVAAPDVAAERWVDGTQVTTCDTGPHVEQYADGAPAARGERAQGARTGTWTRWTPDGRFDGEVVYGQRGELEGRREPTTDGRLLELVVAGGNVVALRDAAPTPQPEWTDGRLAPGLRFAEPRP